MRIQSFAAASIVLLAANAGAQTFSTGFGDGPGDPIYNLTDGGDPPLTVDLAGQNGWQIDDDTGLISFIATRLVGGQAEGSQAGGLGPVYVVPAASTVTVYQNTGVMLSGATFDADFTITESSADDPDLAGLRDAFGFSFAYADATPIFQVSFDPNFDVNPTSDVVVGYSLGGFTTPQAVGLFFGGDYHISINFSPSGNDILFETTLSSAGSSGTFGGVISGAGTASIGRLGVFTTIIEAGDDNITFDNLVLTGTPVPEPGSLTLLGLSAAGLVLHRRRK